MSIKNFDTAITESATFGQMPATTQALYFRLLANTDENGIVNPARVYRILGSSEDDAKILFRKGFINDVDGIYAEVVNERGKG